MKTIIDRAIEEYDRVFEREAYIKGATEQQEIDIEKAVKAHCSLCNHVGLNGVCIIYKDGIRCKDVELIKKAMKQ